MLTSHSDGIHEYLTDIECKYWDQKINKDIVMKVVAIVKDCNFAKGIIVSKLGFTPDAKQYARHEGIGLVELREMTDEDWKGRIRKIILNIDASWPELDRVEVEVSETSDCDYRCSGTFTGDVSQIEIISPSGNKATLKELIEESFFKELIATNSIQPIQKVYKYEPGTRMICNEIGRVLFLRAISLTGHIDSYRIQDVIEPQEEVLYYMKCILEGKVILLGKDGKMLKQNEEDD